VRAVAARPIVLICEDELHLRELIRISLDDVYDVVEAGSVAEARAVLEETQPELAIVDLMLPGGSGLDVLRAVHERAGDRVPVVVVTAWATGDYRRAAEEAGATAFVSKPFVPDELAELIGRLLEEAGGG
jgi:DNA-binding response OmpR family regulator